MPAMTVVRREKHRHALITAQPADEFPDLVADLRVEAAGRLVEEQDARPVQQGAGNFEPALHAARNLAYIGVTRGKCLVVLVGQRKALAIAVKGRQTRRRWSKLREWLVVSNRP